MSLKKYIGILVVLTAIIGFVNHHQVDLHNQEIVLQYNNAEHTDVDTQITISILKSELQNLGVTNYKVVENGNGKLKITYFSKTDVALVKRVLLNRIRSQLDTSDNDEDLPFDFPLEDQDVTYNLDVHEIQNGNETDSGLNGIVVLELKPKADRFEKPKTASFSFHKHSEKEHAESNVAFNLHKRNVCALDKASQQIPEVRAGPHN
ncbi:hypothetical protein EYD45_16220 [Hyunsoonleella flava]|uniref:Uncharacterized protein n=1 Tax=Hyunsoonleella flava TaxID=2527939 RepID=A0A4Q9FG88_9FLAO|nr:hypothetical protein [Hyunsoonleella flava]TBM98872.1 hypothetical protein EYD45_16220 [Hyunsoonleella flava]